MTLRICLLLAGLLTGVVQAALPLVAGETARQFPEVAHLRTPLVVAGVVQLVCFQLVLLATWRLYSRACGPAIFEKGSLPWVTVVQAAAAVAFALTAAELAYVVVASLGPISVPLLGVFALAALGAFLALMSTLRSLLVIAIEDRTEMLSVV